MGKLLLLLLRNSDTSKLGPKCDHVLNQKSWVAKLRFHICDYISSFALQQSHKAFDLAFDY